MVGRNWGEKSPWVGAWRLACEAQPCWERIGTEVAVANALVATSGVAVEFVVVVVDWTAVRPSVPQERQE